MEQKSYLMVLDYFILHGGTYMGGQSVETEVLSAVVFELLAMHNTAVSPMMRQQAHALFLNLVKQIDPSLSARLHNEPGPRPFTVSPLCSVSDPKERMLLKRGQSLFLRITLLDGGTLWHRLSTHFLEAGTIVVQLGGAPLQLKLIFSTPVNDPTGWVGSTTWQTLVSLPVAPIITIHFVSPTAFSIGTGKRSFALVPRPRLLWESLLRVWNAYAPPQYQFPRTVVKEEVISSIQVTHCDLQVETLHYSGYLQKGFLGTCTYQIPVHRKEEASLTALAAFAYYAGVGYKTTMGMGQVRTLFKHRE